MIHSIIDMFLPSLKAETFEPGHGKESSFDFDKKELSVRNINNQSCCCKLGAFFMRSDKKDHKLDQETDSTSIYSRYHRHS